MASVASLFRIVIGVTPLGQTGSDGCRPFHSIVKSIQKGNHLVSVQQKLPTFVGSSTCGCTVRCQDIQAASRLDVRSRDRCEVAVLAATLPEATAPNQSRSISELAPPSLANQPIT